MTRSADKSFVVLVICVLLATTGASAQNVTSVPNEVSCPSCRIEVSTVVRLGPEGQIPTAPESVTRDASGRYWITFTNELAMAYGPSGRYIRTLPKGEGPAEFMFPFSIYPVADSLVVMDRSKGTIVLGPDLKQVRVLPRSLSMGPALMLHWPDSVLMNTQRRDRPGDMNPYHVVSFSGSEPAVLRSFGAEREAPTDPREFVSLRRVIAASASRGLWSAEYNRYRLYLVTMNGQVSRTLVRAPNWFPSEPTPMNMNEPPPPHIAAIHEDTAGLLWVFTRMAAPTWKEGYPRVGPGAREVSVSAFEMDKLYRARLEIIDPRTGRVVTRHDIDAHVIGVLSDGSVGIYKTTADGEPYVEISRLVLRK